MGDDVRVYVENNPFSQQTLRDLQHLTSDHSYRGPGIYFSVNDYSGTDRPAPPLGEVVAIWLPDESDIKGKWAAIGSEENASAFSAFLDRLADTVSARRDPGFKEKVAAWLTMLADSPGLRELTFTVAQDATASCEDRVIHSWNEMQKRVLVHRIESGEFDNNLSGLVDAGRIMFRLEILEEIAREKVKTLQLADEVEIFLAYQTLLCDKLALSSVAKEMRFFAVSGVTEDDLKAAEIEVKRAENSTFTGWFSLWTPWHQVLQRTETARWQQTTEARYTALDEAYPLRVARELAAARLKNDPDAERTAGKRVMEEMDKEIFIPLTQEVLAARELGALTDPLWPV